MKDMIRWSYVAPRVLVLLLVVLLLQYAAMPLLRWCVLTAVESTTGVAVEVEQFDSSVLACRLSATGIGLASSRQADRHLLHADELMIQLKRSELLKKRLVVTEGRLSGVQFNTPRRPNAEAIDEDNSPSDNGTGSRAMNEAARWFGQAAAVLSSKMPSIQSAVATVSQQILTEWQTEYSDLSLEADRLQANAQDLRSWIEGQKLDVSAIRQMHEAAERVQSIRNEYAALRVRADRLRAKVDEDRQRMFVAKQEDQQRIEDLLELTELDGEKFSDYLLGEQCSDRVQQVAAWVDWGRRHMPSKRTTAEPTRMRGINVRFPSVRERPNLWVRSLLLDGQIPIEGSSVPFTGIVRDWTPQPSLIGQPVVVDLQSSGETQLQLTLISDRTTETPVDRIRLRCPALAHGQQIIGRSDQFGLEISPGNLQIDLVATVHDNQLRGNLLLTKSDVQLAPVMSPDLGDEQLASELAGALRSFDELQVAVHLAGTVRDPQWTLRSGIGQQVAEVVSAAFLNQLASRKKQLVELAEAQFTQQQQQLDQQLARQHKKLSEKLSQQDAAVAELKKKLLPDLNLQNANLGWQNLLRN